MLDSSRRFLVGAIATALVSGVPALAQSLDPLVVWGNAGSTAPNYATHDGTSWSGLIAGPDVGGSSKWVVVKPAPTRSEYAVGLLDTLSDVNLVFWDGSAWGTPTEVSSEAGTGQRSFDLAHEAVSGDMIIVYADTVEANLGYRVHDGTTLAAEVDIAMPSASAPQWVALYPQPGTDKMMLLLCQSDASLHASEWSGSAWSGWTQLCADTGGWSGPKRILDLAYESQSGDAVVVYRSASNDDPGFRTWNGSSWSAEGALGPVPTAGQIPVQLRLVADPDPSSDEILFGMKGGAYDIVVGTWSGSAWSALQQIEPGSVDHSSSISFDIAYEPGGGEALVVYSENLSNVLRYRTWNGTVWSGELSGTDVGAFKHNVHMVTGEASGEIFIAIDDSGEELNLLRWDGSAMSATHEIDLSTLDSSSDGDLQVMMGVHLPSTSAGNLLMVVADATTLLPQEILRRAEFEGWGYAVTVIDDSDSQANYDAAVAANDVVYIPEDTASTQLGTKLLNAPIGVLIEESDCYDDFDLTATGVTSEIETSIEIRNYDHFITAPFAAGTLTICSSAQPMNKVTQATPRGAQVLADWPFGGHALIAVDAGCKLKDNSRAAGRRVFMFVADNDFDWATLNADGLTLVQRSIEWAAGLMAHWRMDETSGSIAADSVGPHVGTLTTMDPTTDWVAGRSEGALDFDGLDDRVVTAGSFVPPDQGTICFWMRVPGSPSAHGRILGVSDSWEVRHVTDGSTETVPYGLVFDVCLTGGNTSFVTTTTVDQPNRWYFIAASYDTSDGSYEVYIDGELHKSGTATLAAPGPGTLTIGTRTGSSNYFVGALDDVRIASHKMGADEIAALMMGLSWRVVRWQEVDPN